MVVLEAILGGKYRIGGPTLEAQFGRVELDGHGGRAGGGIQREIEDSKGKN